MHYHMNAQKSKGLEGAKKVVEVDLKIDALINTTSHPF